MSLEIEITMELLSAELISQILLCIQIYTWGIINRHVDLVVPTFKETSYPIEEVFQVHTDDVIDSDFSFIDSEPLDIYSRQEFSDEESQDTVYGTEEEFNTLFYDLDNDSDNEASEDLENNNLYHSANHLHLFQGQIQRFLHLCAHSKIHNQCVLLKLLVRSRECGLKLYSNQNLKSIHNLL